MFKNKSEISFKLAGIAPSLFAQFALSLRINRENTCRFYCTEKGTFFPKINFKK